MYSVVQNTFGSYKSIELTDTRTGALVQILPELGGNINKVLLHTGGKLVSAISGTAAAEDIEKEKTAFKGANLLPFPNRVNNAAYTWEGKNYTLAANDAPRPHSLHGFIFNMPLTLAETGADENGAKVTLTLDYKATVSGFPFPFMAEFTYLLNERGLTLTTKVTNTGTGTLPVGHGWHPYFGAPDIDKLKIKFPPCCEIVMNEVLIPTGERKPFHTFDSLTALGNFKADSCYELTGNEALAEVIIEDPFQQATFVFWQNAAAGYRYLQVYTTPSRNMIAIEPMTCAPDALNNKMGLVELKKGESREWSCGMEVL